MHESTSLIGLAQGEMGFSEIVTVVEKCSVAIIQTGSRTRGPVLPSHSVSRRPTLSCPLALAQADSKPLPYMAHTGSNRS